MQPNEAECPLCSSASLRFFIKRIDINDQRYPLQIREYFKNVEFIHYKCNSCDFVFLPKPDDLILSSYYDDEYYKTNYCSISDSQIKEFESRLGEFLPYLKGNKILDVGCALGYSLATYSGKKMDAYGMECSGFAVELARKNTKFDVIQQSIESNTTWRENFFDAVTLHDVFEHLAQPISALKEIHRILKVGGILYIYTLNWNGLGRKLDGLEWPLLNPPGHMSYWTPKSLAYALEKTGFSIIKLDCPRLVSNHRSIMIIDGLMRKRFPVLTKIISLLRLGDLIRVIAVKTECPINSSEV